METIVGYAKQSERYQPSVAEADQDMLELLSDRVERVRDEATHVRPRTLPKELPEHVLTGLEEVKL